MSPREYREVEGEERRRKWEAPPVEREVMRSVEADEEGREKTTGGEDGEGEKRAERAR